MKIFKILTIYDIILIIFIFLIAFTSIIGFFFFLEDNFDGEKSAVIKIDNQEIQRFSLDGSSRTENFTFEIEEEQYNGELIIDNEQVRLKRLSKDILPLSIHADTGWIRNQIQIIVALPIKLTVQIEDNNENENDSEYDGISY